MKVTAERSIATILITFFAFGMLSFAALMALPYAGHQAGCEFSLGETSICLMSATGMSTLSAKLSQAQTTDMSSLLILAVPLAVAVFLLFAPRRRKQAHLSSPQDPPFSLYTYLYSQGILNPKAP